MAFLSKRKISLAGGFLLAGLILLLFFVWERLVPEQAKPVYTQTYRLVPEKISQSAAIRIDLPPGIDESFVREHVKFEPAIEGTWLKETARNWIAFAKEDSRSIFFKPKEKLKQNRYYAVELTTPEKGTIKSDFLAVEDPEITAIFPKENSEAPEHSEITIVFNRPMVPLTTLTELEKKEVPVGISPATQGRFKWITTRNLQFIPRERLVRSSRYTVRIEQGFLSMDGLSVSSKETHFTTRKLRLQDVTKDEVGYNQPISLYFNQPVDLEKTREWISLKEAETGKPIPFLVEYEKMASQEKDERESRAKTDLLAGFGVSDFFENTRKRFGFSRQGDETENPNINTSTLRIFNAQDRFGRKKLWDFGKQYTVEIRKAYPMEGDIAWDQTRQDTVRVADIIKNIRAESQRTSYASPEFFDPQGKLWVEFYEEIDLARSKITAPRLKEIGYGERCKDMEREVFSGVECEKITDKKKVFLVFEDKKVKIAERIPLRFEKIENVEGLEITREPLERFLASYPEFRILSTFPSLGSQGVDLQEITFCTTTPLTTPVQEEWGRRIKANLPFEMIAWQRSWKVEYPSLYRKCGVGEFETKIRYGLMPLENYDFVFELEDVFSQQLERRIGFHTGPMPKERLDLFSFQRSYNVTSPERTKLTYALTNMEFVELEICKLPPHRFLFYLENEPKPYESSSVFVNCQESFKTSISLPKRFWVKNYFNIDIANYFADPIGHYAISLSHPNYMYTHWEESGRRTSRRHERTFLTVTNIAAAEKKIEPEAASFGSRKPLSDTQLRELQNMYWVTNISSLEPIAGATVRLYQGKNLSLAASASTNAQGVAFTKTISDLKGATITYGDDSTVIPSSESKFNWADLAGSAKKIYLYADKPIYQPSQEVFIKGIYRIGYDGNYEIFRDRPVQVKMYNSKDDEILNQNLQVSEFGTFDTKLLLEKDSPLGTYRICAEEHFCAFIDVQEYVPAPFEVTVKSDKEEYISKDSLTLDVQGAYFFGVPLETGKVFYTFSSQNYYFDRYGSGAIDFEAGRYYEYPFEYGDKFLLRGETALVHGKARISQTLDFEELFKNQQGSKSKIMVADVTVQDPQGRSVSSQKSFIVHAGEFYLGMKAEKTFLGKEEPVVLSVKSVATDGKEVRVKNGVLSLFKVDWIYAKRQSSGGGFSYQWERKRDLTQTFEFETDGKGNYAREIKLNQEGQYELEASAKDQRGNTIRSILHFYVYGEKSVRVRPTEGTQLELEPADLTLDVNQTGELIIKSPYEKAKAFIAIERGKVFDYEIKEIRGNLANYTFLVKEEYIPNVFLSVLLQSANPEIKFGQVEFQINTERKRLDIAVQSNKTHYLPGEEVRLDITAKDYQGTPVFAELSVSVVDLSVLALKGNPKKDPLVFFYDGFPLTVSTSSNIKSILLETKIPTKGGGGVKASQDLARKVRGEFLEQAFWQAVVRTDEKGRASVKFTLPDNLTRWQTESIGIAKDTRLGAGYGEFTTRKDLMIVPLRPRFAVPGDMFLIGAKVFNQTQTIQNVQVSFESGTLALAEGEKSRTLAVGAGQTQTVYFKVQAPLSKETGEHRFALSAKNPAFEDTVIQYIPLVQDGTYEVTASANFTSETVTKEYVFLPDAIVKEKGELSLQRSATLATFLSDALNYLLEYPYGCSEQISSKLNAIAIVKRGLNLPNVGEKFQLKKITYEEKEYSLDELVRIGLAKLANNQRGDGGFSLWRDGDSSFYATVAVAEALRNLSDAGYEINKQSMQRAADYLYHKITTDYELYQNKNNIVLAAYQLFQFPGYKENGVLKQQIIRIASDDRFIHEEVSNTVLAQLAVILNSGFDKNLQKKIFDALDNRVDIDGRGAFLESNKNFLWYYYETPIKNTALYLKSLVARKEDSPLQDKVIRWLLHSRTKDRSWGTTNNTLAVVDAFTDFLVWKRETESDFTLEVLINGVEKDSFRFYPETILDQRQTKIPLQELQLNSTNVVQFSKKNNNKLANHYYYDLALKYYLPADQIPPRDEGLSITRGFYGLEDKKNERPLTKAKAGDVARVHLQLTIPKTRNHVIVEDFIPAGFEIVNLDLATEQKSLRLQERESDMENRELSVDFKELHNDRAFLYKETLYPGVYEFDYFVRALIPGKFIHLPAVTSEMYFPENFGRTAGGYFHVEQ